MEAKEVEVIHNEEMDEIDDEEFNLNLLENHLEEEIAMFQTEIPVLEKESEANPSIDAIIQLYEVNTLLMLR